MFITRHDFALAVDASGNQTVYSSRPVNGTVRQVTYVPDPTTPLATGGVLTITAEASTLPIVTITSIGTVAVTFAPRQATHSVAAAALLYAAAGTAVTDQIAIAGERIKVVVTLGGVSRTGTLYIWVG